MRIIYLLIATSLICNCYAQEKGTYINFRIFPSDITQTEPVIAVHPTNPLIMFASSVTINTTTGFKSEGVYVSTNGGSNWFGSDTCKGSYIGNHGGDPGVAINNDGTLILTHIGSLFPGVYSHYSTNLGLSWSNAITITSQQPEDKGSTTIDADSNSPYYERAYTAWVNFTSPYPVLCSYSTTSGQSWTPSQSINNPPPARCSGGYIKTGINGKVYVCWAGKANTFPFIEDFVGFAVSTNGGVDWSVTQNAFDANGINGTLPTKNNILVNGLPHLDIDRSNGSRRGNIYIVTTEINLSPAGSDPDIILHRSTDNGITWSSGVRVNQDLQNNGKIQYFPSIHVDSGGGVNIIYYDDRNTTSDSAEIILARSENGGVSWTETVISNHRFQPKPIVGGSSNYQGDHISLTSAGKKLYAFWMDNYSGLYQIWASVIDITTLGVRETEQYPPEKFLLAQNYPNPFNFSTIITYQILTDSYVTIKVYNLLGVEVVTLVDGLIKAGRYDVQWNGSSASGRRLHSSNGLSSGCYFYRLTTSGGTITKPMILLK